MYLKANAEDDFETYIQKTAQFLDNKQYAYHFMVIPKQYDFQSYTNEMKEKHCKGVLADVGRYYFDFANDMLEDDYVLYNYTTYLLIHLNHFLYVAPENVFDTIKRASSVFADVLEKTLTLDYNIDDDFQLFQKQEKQLFNQLTGKKGLTRLTEKEMEQLIYYHFHRTAPFGEVPESQINLTEGIIRNKIGHLEIIHEEDKREYIAFLPFKKLPESIYNYRFVSDLVNSLDFPVEVQVKFTFKENKDNVKLARKYKKRFTNFKQDLQKANADNNDVIFHGAERLEHLQDDLKRGKRNLLYTSIYLVVAERDLSVLNQKVERIFSLYKDDEDFELVRPKVDHLTLFAQSLPAATKHYNYYEQVFDQYYLAQAGFDINQHIGNDYGFLLGKIVTGINLQRVEEAREMVAKIVMFNPLLTKNNLPGAKFTNGNMLITGPPGSGKSMAIKNLFVWCCFLGAKILYVDPKNELVRFFREAVERFPEADEGQFKKLYEGINFVEVSNKPEYAGIFDPFIFLREYEEDAMAVSKDILLSLGNVDTSNDEGMRRSVLIGDALKQVFKNDDFPTLTKVVAYIKEHNETFGKFLEQFNIGYGRMLFGHEKSKSLNFSSQINVLGTQGLDLPKAGATKMTDSQKIGMNCLIAINKYLEIFSTDREEDAMVVLDEAYTLTYSEIGKKSIDSLLRQGRSLRTDVILLTHSFKDLDEETLQTKISCKMTFKPQSKDEYNYILKHYDLEQNVENRRIIENLRSGICLFQDYRGRSEVVAVDILFSTWYEAFKTTKNNERYKLEV